MSESTSIDIALTTLEKKRDELKAELATVEAELASLKQIQNKYFSNNKKETSGLNLSYLKELPTNKALIMIAKYFNGVLRIAEAKEILVNSGKFDNPQQAANNINSTLSYSKDFKKDEKERGVYHYISVPKGHVDLS